MIHAHNTALDRTVRLGLCASGVLLCSLTFSTTQAATMLVTEVQGEVLAEDTDQRIAPVVPLASKVQLRIAPNAHVVIAYVEDAEEFELRGPGRFRIEAGAPRVLDGALVPIVRSLPSAYRTIRLDAAKVKQLGVVMRGEPADKLTPQGMLLDVPTAVSWYIAGMRPPYEITLADFAGNLVLHERAQTATLALPADALHENVRYRWSVEGTGGDGQHHIRATSFVIPDAAMRARLLELKNGADAPARQALYEAVLATLALSVNDPPMVAQKISPNCRRAPGSSDSGDCVPEH